MAPGDLDPNSYIPLWRLVLGRAWLTPQQRREADKAATAPAAATNPPHALLRRNLLRIRKPPCTTAVSAP